MKTKIMLSIVLIGLAQINLLAQFAGGSGTTEDPYQVQTLEQLQAIGNVENLDKHFLQIADIDATETVNWNNGQGFNPIGNSTFIFNGSYNGNYYNITNLFISRNSQENVGLFGDAVGSFSNINIINANIEGHYIAGVLVGNAGPSSVINSKTSGIISGNVCIGGLIGQNNYATIVNCHSSCNVTSNQIFAGGLIGLSNASVINCSSVGSVTGNNVVGGLIGHFMIGEVENSFAKGNVTATGYDIGGLIGYKGEGSIINSYANGNIIGDQNVGGLVGSNKESAIISFSFSNGSVSGNSNVGGFVGLNSAAINNCYWDKESSAQTSAVGTGYSSGVIGLNTTQMINVSAYENMTGFEFGVIWKLTENYPALYWEDVEAIFPHVPNAPALLTPINNSENLDIETIFTWETVPFSETFTIQISTYFNFDELIIETYDLAEYEYSTNELEWGSAYYWRVLATNALGNSVWSEVYTFSTMPAFNFSINSGETYCFEDQIEIGVEVNIEFETDNIFLIELSNKHGSFDNPVILAQIDTINSFVTEVSVPDTLEFGTPYLIRVKSTNPEVYSNNLSFTVYQLPTSTFALDAEQLCDSEIVTVSYTGNATENANYDWTFDGGNIISGSGQGDYVVSWDTSGTKTISLSVTENGCFSDSYSLSLPVYDPVSDFSMDNIVCENLNTMIEFIGFATDSAMFNWDFDNANIISGSGVGPYEVNWDELGTKNVSLSINDNGCMSTTTTKAIDHNPIPTATIAAPERICYDGVANLNYTGSASSSASFNWDFDGGTLISGTGSGPYEVTWSNDGLKNITMIVENNGCSSDTLIQLIVNPQTQPNPICMVTVSESNKNMIVWVVPDDNPYESIVIYKESVQSDVYDVISTQSVSESSFFIDENSNPSQNSSRYKLAVIDTCGYETGLSDYHKTMHLTINAGMDGTWNLIWDRYEGFDYSSFNIYRGTTDGDLTKIAEQASNTFTYSDLTPPSGTVYYQIEVINPNPCDINIKKSSQNDYSSTRSNIINSQEVTSVYGVELNSIIIWPNPVSDILYINSENLNANNNLIISTVDGRLLVNKKIERGTTNIDMSGFPKGIYILKLTSGIDSVNKKIIKH